MNLRLPSMLHGKKGFERLIWACKNVLDQSLTWLFVDLNASADTDEEGNMQVHLLVIIHGLYLRLVQVLLKSTNHFDTP